MSTPNTASFLAGRGFLFAGDRLPRSYPLPSRQKGPIRTMAETNLFTSESVTEGHPDKLADQISDAVLDELLKQDVRSRVALETFLTRGLAVVGGELTTNAYVEIADVV